MNYQKYLESKYGIFMSEELEQEEPIEEPVNSHIEEEKPVEPEVPKLATGFVAKLIDYLEKTFPAHGALNQNIGTELKKEMGVGDENKMKEVNRVKKKISDTIQKEKQRFLDRVHNKVENIKLKKVEKDNGEAGTQD